MRWVVLSIVAVGALLVGSAAVYTWWNNPRVIRELREHPDGERARKVMLLTLPSGRSLPVNYIRDRDKVYAAADFPWWRELRGGGGRGSALIRGETLHGHVRVVEDDPVLRDDVFERLRPAAPRWTGTLVVIDLDPPGSDSESTPTKGSHSEVREDASEGAFEGVPTT